MKYTLGLILCVILTSCVSSFETVRKSEPYRSFQSNKEPEALAKCILHGWQKGHADSILNYGETYMQPHYLDGYTVFTEANMEFVDILKANSITNLNYYHQGGTFQYRINQRVEAIEECLQ